MTLLSEHIQKKQKDLVVVSQKKYGCAFFRRKEKIYIWPNITSERYTIS